MRSTSGRYGIPNRDWKFGGMHGGASPDGVPPSICTAMPPGEVRCGCGRGDDGAPEGPVPALERALARPARPLSGPLSRDIAAAPWEEAREGVCASRAASSSSMGTTLSSTPTVEGPPLWRPRREARGVPMGTPCPSWTVPTLPPLGPAKDWAPSTSSLPGPLPAPYPPRVASHGQLQQPHSRRQQRTWARWRAHTGQQHAHSQTTATKRHTKRTTRTALAPLCPCEYLPGDGRRW